MEQYLNVWIPARHLYTVRPVHLLKRRHLQVTVFSVSRPLFIEEHGLRLLLDREGVGVELSRESYEAGDWATAVEEAWVNGREAKSRKRSVREMGIELEKSNEQGQAIARTVVDWVQEWWSRAA
jgi:hypothetical protein